MSNIRDTVGHMVGRRIDHVFTRTIREDSRDQIYIHFDDGTHIEFYGSIQCSSRLRPVSITELRSMFTSQLEAGTFKEYPAHQTSS